MPSKFAHTMRSEELAIAIRLLPPGGHILELGAGDGWQAAILSQQGFLVSAVDVSPAPPDAMWYAPVTIYDGVTLPFADDTFDAIFSSNVLEHLKDFDRTHVELARVLKPGGLAVHCVPTAVWRFWTTVGHPLYALRWMLGAQRCKSKSPSGPHAKRTRDLNAFELFRLGILAPRHGELGNVLTEHYLFSRRGWVRRFRATHWRIVSAQPTHLFYTGNELFGLSIRCQTRVRLASVLGSSTYIFATSQPSEDFVQTDVATSL